MEHATDLPAVVDVHHVDWCEDNRTVACWLILADGRIAGWYYELGLPPGGQDMTLRIIEGA